MSNTVERVNPLKSQYTLYCKCKLLQSMQPYVVSSKGNCREFVDSCKLLSIRMSKDIADNLRTLVAETSTVLIWLGVKLLEEYGLYFILHIVMLYLSLTILIL